MEGYKNIIESIEKSFIFFYELFEAYIIILIIFLAVVGLISLLSYIFKTITCSKISKELNLKYRWLSYIPLFNNSILTKVAFNNYVVGIIMSLLIIVYSFIGQDNQMLFKYKDILLLIYILMYIYTAFKIYKKYSKNYVILTIISILTFGLTIPYMLFAIRKNKLK